MASSAKDIPSTTYKPQAIAASLDPATVIRTPQPDSQASGGSHPSQANSATLGKLFPGEEGRNTQAELPAGLKLGQYIIEARIGAGGMGAVFRARDERLDRLVALKILSPSQANDPAAIKRFQNEARAAARLDHDNIARIYAVGEDQGLYFIAFEYVEGITVRELIRQRGMVSPQETIDFMLQISVALKHTAAAGVVHRDIKPSNLILTPQGRAKLVDWGLARKERLDDHSLDLTVSGTTLGTFDYISPEQARDPRNVDVRSDIYSLGCTSYHMLTGSPPYAEGTVLQKLLDHQGKIAPDPRDRNPNVPKELSRIVRKMMASDPVDRYWTPQALTHDLLILANETGLRPVHPDGLTWRSPQERAASHVPNGIFWWWLGAFSTACVVAIMADRWMLSQDMSPLSAQTQASILSENPVPVSPLISALAPDRITNREHSLPAPFTLPPSDLVSGSHQGSYIFPQSQGPIQAGEFPQPIVNGLTNGNRVAQGTPWLFPDLGPELDAPGASEREPGLIMINVEKELNSFVPAPGSANSGKTETVRPPMPLPNTPDATFQILARNGDFIQNVADLETALHVVPDGGVIEFTSLQGKSSLFRLRQLRIVDKSVTIRSASNSQMILRFDASQQATDARAGDFINIKAGALILSNLHIQVVVPRTPPAGWSLFSIEGTGRLRCRETTITVESPQDQQKSNASIVRLNRSTLQTVDSMKADGTSEDTLRRLQFNDCVVRGMADFLLVDSSEPAALEISRSLITLEGALVRYLGDNNIRNQIDSLEIRLSRVAGIVNEGVVRMDLGMSIPRQPMQIHIRTEDSILIGQNGQPLVQYAAALDQTQLQNLLFWDGEHNLYGGWERFLAIRGTANLENIPVAMSYETWTQGTGQIKEAGARQLKNVTPAGEPQTRLDQWTARKFLSILQAENPDKLLTSDLADYGPDFYDLPVPPSMIENATSKPAAPVLSVE